MITERDALMVLAQAVPIIAVWVRLERRLSKLEGSFTTFCDLFRSRANGVIKRSDVDFS